MTSAIEYKVEQFIYERGTTTVNEVLKNVGDITKNVVRSIVSHLVIKNDWRIKHMKGKLYIYTKPEKLSSTIHHCSGGVVNLQPKCIPINRDWVVTCIKGCEDRLFFDGNFTLTEVRHAFSKIKKVKFYDVRARRYRKIKTFKTMQNF